MKEKLEEFQSLIGTVQRYTESKKPDVKPDGKFQSLIGTVQPM